MYRFMKPIEIMTVFDNPNLQPKAKVVVDL